MLTQFFGAPGDIDSLSVRGDNPFCHVIVWVNCVITFPTDALAPCIARSLAKVIKNTNLLVMDVQLSCCTWFCYQLKEKTGNKTAAPSPKCLCWPTYFLRCDYRCKKLWSWKRRSFSVNPRTLRKLLTRWWPSDNKNRMSGLDWKGYAADRWMNRELIKGGIQGAPLLLKRTSFIHELKIHWKHTVYHFALRVSKFLWCRRAEDFCLSQCFVIVGAKL